MEMMGCDLHRVIYSKQVLTERHHRCFLKQILEGINYMHKSRIIHSNLRPSSFLVDRCCRLRINELDQARYIGYECQDLRFLRDEEELPDRVYARWNTAPEVLLSFRFLKYSESIDMFSIGTIFGEMLKRAPLFPGKSHSDQLKLYFQFVGYEDGQELGFSVVEEARAYLSKRCVAGKVNLTKELPNASLQALHLLDCLIQTNPTKRPVADVALLHPFLDDAETVEDYSNIPSPCDLIDPDQLFDFEVKGNYSLEEMREKIAEECQYYRLANQL
jgi:serine/threonine protein kinase